MAVYTTTKCGHCGDTWEWMEQGITPSIGTPVIKCRKCDGLNYTKHVLYRDASIARKIRFWFGQSITTILYGFGGIAIGVGMISSMDEPKLRWVGFLPLCIGFYQIYILTQTIKNAKQNEEVFDRNGGFVWSDEVF